MSVFYAVSTGAGNPELITLQAVRVLKSCQVIFYPESEKNTFALDTIKNIGSEINLSAKNLLPCKFSMTGDRAKSYAEYEKIAEQCMYFLKSGKNVAMLSIGDVSLYSTAGRTSRLIHEAGFEVKFIAGVNSFSAAACSSSTFLCENDESLTVIPGDSFFNEGKLEAALQNEGSKILMKMGRHLKEIIQMLAENRLIEDSILVQKASLPDEKIFYGRKILEMTEKDFETAYLSLIIVSRKN